MGKTKRIKEFDDIQKLKNDNKKLRIQVSKLRKVIKNIDLDHYNFVKDLLESDNFNETPIKVTNKKLEEKWSCYKCDSGILRLIIVNKCGEPYYFRKCDYCENKTKTKKYNEDIKGV